MYSLHTKLCRSENTYKKKKDGEKADFFLDFFLSLPFPSNNDTDSKEPLW